MLSYSRTSLFILVGSCAFLLPTVRAQENCLLQQVFSGRYYGVDAELNDISTCVKIDLEDAYVTTPMVKTLSEALAQTAPKLSSLNMKDTKLTDEGVSLLLNALEHRPSLKSIDFSHNEITAEGAKKIAEFLKKKGIAIEYLNLAVNSIGDEGAIAIAKSVHTNGGFMKRLVLRSNKIDMEGVKAFAAVMEENKRLVEVNLKYNKFDKTSLIYINLLNHCLLYTSPSPRDS